MHDATGRNPDDIRVGGWVKALREAHGLSRSVLAGEIGCSHKLVAAIEQGHRKATPPVRRKLVDRFAVPLAALDSDELAARYVAELREQVRPEAVSAA